MVRYCVPSHFGLGAPFAYVERMQAPKKPKPRREPVEKDKGYNASHGYGVGHGGPSGPGDVPSPPASLPPTTKKDGKDMERELDRDDDAED